MTVTENRLVSALTAQADAVRPDPAAASRLSTALRVRRRHTWLATAVAAAMVVAGVAVGLTVPGHTSHATVVPTKPSTPYPAYQQGGKAIAGGQITSPAQGTLTFTFVPTSYALYLGMFCSDSRTVVSVAVNGHLATFGGCGGGVGTTTDEVASRAQWKGADGVVLGHSNTVTVTLVDGDTPTAQPLAQSDRPTGTVAAAMYQGVPVADYPLPPKPAHLPPLVSNGGEPVVLDSRVVGADGTFTVPLTAGQRLDLAAVAPGQIEVRVDDVPLETHAFWTYHGQYALIDLSVPRLRAVLGVPDIRRVTVTVVASRFAGPSWLVSTAMAPSVGR